MFKCFALVALTLTFAAHAADQGGEAVRVLYSSQQLGKVALQRSNQKEIWFEECDLAQVKVDQAQQATLNENAACKQLGNARIPNDPLYVKLFNVEFSDSYRAYVEQNREKNRGLELFSVFTMTVSGGVTGAVANLVTDAGPLRSLQTERPLLVLGGYGAAGAVIAFAASAYLTWSSEQATEKLYQQMNPVEGMAVKSTLSDDELTQFYQDMNALLAQSVANYNAT